jgi:hypothetical protein
MAKVPNTVISMGLPIAIPSSGKTIRYLCKT